MDRDLIERRDFSTARRGYDPDEVDNHLRRIAEQVGELERGVGELERGGQRPAGVAGTAADQVRGIVEAAEGSASEIQKRAEADARRTGEEAETHAREVRERAQANAAEQVAQVRHTADRMLERASSAESEVSRVLDTLRTEAGSIVENLRTSAKSVRRELDQLREDLPALRADAAATGAGTGVAEVTVPDVDVTGEQQEELPAEETPDEVMTDRSERAAEDEPEEPLQGTIAGSEGARLIAFNMALNGTSREETARYLADNFNLADQDAVLDEAYSRVGT